MITIKNIASEYPKLNQATLPDALKANEYEFVAENLDLYNDDKTIKEYIDTFVAKLNEATSSKFVKDHIIVAKPDNKPQQKKAVKQPKPKFKVGDIVNYMDKVLRIISVNNYDTIVKDWIYTATCPEWGDADNVGERSLTKAKKPKAEKTKPEYTGEYTEKVLPEISFIKRYANLHGKNVTKQQSLSLLKGLQRAITERTIRKTSPYATEIETIQGQLVRLVNVMGASAMVEIEAKNLEKYKSIAGSQKTMPCVNFVKRFLTIQGKEGVKDKAKRLLTEIERANINPSDAMKHKISEIKQALSEYVKGNKQSPEVSESILNGLAGICKCKIFKQKSKSNGLAGLDGIVSSEDIARMKFKITRFDGKWAQCIGNPGEPFKLMIYGVPGQGKSTLAIQFAHYLASKHNKKVLYIAGEEKVGYTLQEKINRLNAAHPNLMAAPSLPTEAILKKFDVVFFDSVNTLNIASEELREITDKNPKMSIVYLLQTTKEGDFRGSQEYEHDADAVLEVTDFVAKPGKNRFGGKEPVKVI